MKRNMSTLTRLSTPTTLKGTAFAAQLHTAALYIGSVIQFQSEWKKYEWLLPIIDVDVPLGIEIEVENIVTSFPLPGFIASKVDNSLRNNGVEFTTVPLKPKELYQGLVLLWLMMDKVNKRKKPDFSWRVSDHLHVDINSLTEEQFQVFLILGIVFERLLFAMSKEERNQSVFCVPVGESNVVEFLSKYLKGQKPLTFLVQSWPKYTAIHLGRMFENPDLGPALGTVEFRHQSGTKNLEHLFIWIALILRLYEYARNISMENLTESISSMNSPQQYQQFMSAVLTPALMEKFLVKDYNKLFANQVATAKRILLKPVEPKGTAKSSLAIFISKDIKKNEERFQREKAHQEKLKKQFPDPITWTTASVGSWNDFVILDSSEGEI